MKASLSLLISLAASAVVRGFAPLPSFGVRRSVGGSSAVSSLFMSTETPCDVPSDAVNPDLVVQKGSGKILRSVMLTDINGDTVKLGDKMGETSVVVFLRHMG